MLKSLTISFSESSSPWFPIGFYVRHTKQLTNNSHKIERTTWHHYVVSNHGPPSLYSPRIRPILSVHPVHIQQPPLKPEPHRLSSAITSEETMKRTGGGVSSIPTTKATTANPINVVMSCCATNRPNQRHHSHNDVIVTGCSNKVRSYSSGSGQS